MTVSSSSVTNLFTYDAMNRRTAVADGRGNTAVTHYDALGRADWTEDAAANRTAYGYDARGRVTAVTDALGNTVHTAYDDAGNVSARWGATYPVAYDYDTAGRMTALITARDEASAGWIHGWCMDDIVLYLYIANPEDPITYPYHFDVTRWQYDPATGLCTGKVYADGSVVAHTFTPDGRPLRTTWARGVWRENQYDALGQPSGVLYSDDTPDLSFARNAIGTVTNAAGTSGLSYAYAVNPRQTVTNETVTHGSQVFSLSRTFDGLNRPETTAVRLNSSAYAAKTRAYDSAGRVATLAFTNAQGRVCVAAYAYDGNRETNLTVTLPGGGTFARSLARDPCRPSLVARHDYAFNGSPVFWYACTHDTLGRVTNATDSASPGRGYLYNARSEVEDAEIGDEHFGYLWDGIGNLGYAETYSPSLGVMTSSPDANGLNQYGYFDGWLSHDGDGNQTSFVNADVTVIRDLEWDAENRLAVTRTYADTYTYTFHDYDHLHRRVRLYESDGPNGACTRTFVWDGWLPVLELIEYEGGFTDTVEYFWGNDLSGTEQGAGGVGGLIAVSIYGMYYLPCYDHNGNIVAYVSESGNIEAQYAYNAFGGTLWQSGMMADLFRFRFSTKYQDASTGLYYYGYRFYSPELMRFLNRDPIAERGGLNLYGFVGNDPVNKWDRLGLKLSGPDRIVLYAKSADDRRNRVTFKQDSTREVCKWKAEGNISISKQNKSSATISPIKPSGTVGDSKITASYYGGGEESLSVTVIYPKQLTRKLPTEPATQFNVIRFSDVIITIFDQFDVSFPEGVAVSESVDVTASGFANVGVALGKANTNSRGEVSDTFGGFLSDRAALRSYINIYQQIHVGEWTAIVVSQMLYSDYASDGTSIGPLVKFHGMSRANFH